MLPLHEADVSSTQISLYGLLGHCVFGSGSEHSRSPLTCAFEIIVSSSECTAFHGRAQSVEHLNQLIL